MTIVSQWLPAALGKGFWPNDARLPWFRGLLRMIAARHCGCMVRSAISENSTKPLQPDYPAVRAKSCGRGTARQPPRNGACPCHTTTKQSGFKVPSPMRLNRPDGSIGLRISRLGHFIRRTRSPQWDATFTGVREFRHPNGKSRSLLRARRFMGEPWMASVPFLASWLI